jgi:hypothetical protein
VRSAAAASRCRRARELVHDVGDDLQERVELVGGPAQVVGGEQEERDDLHALLLAPREQIGDLGRAHPVPVVDVDEARLARPPAVAVEHHRDVPGPLLQATQVSREPALVERVEQVANAHGG